MTHATQDIHRLDLSSLIPINIANNGHQKSFDIHEDHTFKIDGHEDHTFKIDALPAFPKKCSDFHFNNFTQS